MKYLLDTNVCIRYLNGRSPAIRAHFNSVQPDDNVLCSVVKAELLCGALKSARPQENVLRLRQFFDGLLSLPFDDAASEVYGSIRSRLEQAGTPIGPNDLLIAAIAVANDIILVTNNVGEFGRVGGLVIENWE